MTIQKVLAVVALLLPAAALAQDKGEQVEVMAEVVLASTQGAVIDPPTLAAMKEKFAEKMKYTSFRRLDLQKISVGRASSQLKLPNQKVVTFRLNDLKEGAAKITVEVPPASTALTLGREGSLYQAAGKHLGGDLW